MEFVFVLLLMCALGLLADRFGYDSRDEFGWITRDPRA